jgi:hypothetical protein
MARLRSTKLSKNSSASSWTDEATNPRLGCASRRQGIGGVHVRQRRARSEAGIAAVAATNAAIIALAKAFAERGIKDDVQVNSVVPGAVMTGRRRSFLEKWVPAHDMTVEEATSRFPQEAGIKRYGQPEEIADLLAFMVSSAARWMTGASVRMDGGERHIHNPATRHRQQPVIKAAPLRSRLGNLLNIYSAGHICPPGANGEAVESWFSCRTHRSV